MFCREFLDFGFIHQTISRLSSETLRFLKGKQPSKTNSFILYLSKPWHIYKISLLKFGDRRFLSGVNGVERKMVENLAVRRKNRQISTKSRKKLTVKIFLLIATERNSALAVKCPSRDPIKAGNDLEEQWFFYRSNQYFVFHRVTLAICIHLSPTGFVSVSCFWFTYVTRSSHGR